MLIQTSKTLEQKKDRKLGSYSSCYLPCLYPQHQFQIEKWKKNHKGHSTTKRYKPLLKNILQIQYSQKDQLLIERKLLQKQIQNNIQHFHQLIQSLKETLLEMVEAVIYKMQTDQTNKNIQINEDIKKKIQYFKAQKFNYLTCKDIHSIFTFSQTYRSRNQQIQRNTQFKQKYKKFILTQSKKTFNKFQFIFFSNKQSNQIKQIIQKQQIKLREEQITLNDLNQSNISFESNQSSFVNEQMKIQKIQSLSQYSSYLSLQSSSSSNSQRIEKEKKSKLFQSFSLDSDEQDQQKYILPINLLKQNKTIKNQRRQNYNQNVFNKINQDAFKKQKNIQKINLINVISEIKSQKIKQQNKFNLLTDLNFNERQIQINNKDNMQPDQQLQDIINQMDESLHAQVNRIDLDQQISSQQQQINKNQQINSKKSENYKWPQRVVIDYTKYRVTHLTQQQQLALVLQKSMKQDISGSTNSSFEQNSRRGLSKLLTIADIKRNQLQIFKQRIRFDIIVKVKSLVQITILKSNRNQGKNSIFYRLKFIGVDQTGVAAFFVDYNREIVPNKILKFNRCTLWFDQLNYEIQTFNKNIQLVRKQFNQAQQGKQIVLSKLKPIRNGLFKKWSYQGPSINHFRLNAAVGYHIKKQIIQTLINKIIFVSVLRKIDNDYFLVGDYSGKMILYYEKKDLRLYISTGDTLRIYNGIITNKNIFTPNIINPPKCPYQLKISHSKCIVINESRKGIVFHQNYIPQFDYLQNSRSTFQF